MRGRVVRITAAGLAGVVSLGSSISSGVAEQQRLLLLASTVPAQIVPVPPGLAPAGVAVLPPAAPLTAAQQRVIAAALHRDPLDVNTFNLVYANSVRTGAPAPVVQHEADLLSKLGWRFTAAQQNLIIRAALAEDVDGVLNRADALLRRRKLPELGNAVLLALESNRPTTGYVAARLQGNPPWRHDYLSLISAQSPPDLLVGRTRTLRVLLHMPQGATREEIAPSLSALTATGHGRVAYALWRQDLGRPAGDNLVDDPTFRQAASLLGESAGIPFEWQFGQAAGYTVQASPAGAAIDWNRDGVPTFASQVVPVAPGEKYTLTIKGTGDPRAPLSALLGASIDCGNVFVQPESVDAGNGQVRYAFSALPTACDLGQLTIRGAIDAGNGDVSFIITAVDLRRTP